MSKNNTDPSCYTMNLELETYHLKRLIEGDTTSFDAIFIHYHPIVLRFLVGFIKDKEQAQDIAQDIFCKLWISHDRLGHIQSLKSYLFKMCRNAVYDSFDRQIAKTIYPTWKKQPHSLPRSNTKYTPKSCLASWTRPSQVCRRKREPYSI